jgi:sodium-dependent phosphate cotransporter
MTLGKRDILYKSLFLLFLIYLFLVSIRLMGAAFKLFGSGFAEALIAGTTSTFVGLFAGILATSLVQSSSAATSIVVGLVASGSMTVANAVPIVIGANIGTTITNTLVSLGHIHRRREFERAFAGATCHDFFNYLSVIVIFPLQVKFQLVSRIASFFTSIFVRIGGIHIINPLKIATGPTVKLLKVICVRQPPVMLVLAVVLLFLTLHFITRLMRGLVATRAEISLNEHVFRSPPRAFLLGVSLTSIIQSSSVATSLMVPLVGAGIVSVERKFPYTLGTNVGTTVTAILASLATANPAAITIALSHLTFNLIGIAIFYPLRRIPIWLALRLGEIAARRRVFVAVYVLGLFYVVPLVMILIWR